MVGIHARGHVGIQILARKAGCVAVDLLVVRLRCDDLRDDLGVVVDDAVGVHHLGKPLYARIVVERVDGAVVEICARFVHRRSRYARRQHEAHVDGKALGGLEHVVDAVGAHDVGDLVRVGDDGGGAVRQRRAGKFARRDEAGLEMDMRVDEAGTDNLAGHIDLANAVVFAEAHDQAVCHGDVARAQLVGKYTDIGCILQDKIGLLPAGGRLDDALLFQ